MTWIQNLYLGLFVYVLAGVLVTWTLRTHREAVMDLVVKVGRIIPGFEEGFKRGASAFGYGPERKILGSVYNTLAWPMTVGALFVMLYIARAFDKHEAALRSASGAPLVPGGHIATASLRKEVIAERCAQVEDVFAQKQSTYEVMLLDGFMTAAKCVFGSEACANEPFDPHEPEGALILIEQHREVLISSVESFDVESFIAVGILFPKGGSVQVHFQKQEDDATWVPRIALDTLEGSDDGGTTSEYAVAHAALAKLMRVLNPHVAYGTGTGTGTGTSA